MNDWWNDPWDEPEPPQCQECDEGFGDEVECDGTKLTFTCDACGHTWEYEISDPGPDDFTDPEDVEEPPPHGPHCPHGNPWGECSACDHAGDLAYDAAREARVFRR